MKAYLILEDGTVMQGKSFGVAKEVISEIVCNTSMMGYLEVMTDPAYMGQSVVMTYPLIGNYGVNEEDMESPKAWCSGMIVREVSRTTSNFRCEGSLQSFMEQQGVAGIEGIDTRELTRILRDKGTMNGMITTEEVNVEEVLPRIQAYRVQGGVKEASCKELYHPATIEKSWDNIHRTTYKASKAFEVAVLDFGVKQSMVQTLLKMGCNVTVYPCDTKAETIINANPNGILLSSGAGDPKECAEVIEEVKKLYESAIPIFAVGLGHQLMALATGADTEKMKYGHRGGNYPVKDRRNGKVYISTQNHGYVVKEDSLDKNLAEVAFYNVNDGTIEGLHYLGKNILTIQFYPELSSGSKEAEFLYSEFINMMEIAGE